jgi:thymidylate synthase
MKQNSEQQYLDLMAQTLSGVDREDRTGVGSISTWGAQIKFDLSDGFPLFTTRQLSARLGIEETLFFLRGETDTKLLEAKNINIWSGNTSREFLDSRGLTHLPVGDMGKGYGHQIRNFGGDDERKGFDQLTYLIKNIKENPSDRRHYISYWHPQVLTEAALPPCHLSFNCQVVNGVLNSCFYMRSSDLYHGLPHNVVGYAFLTHLIANLTGLRPGTMVYMAADCHIYRSQIDVVEEQLTREPLALPKFEFTREFSSLDDALSMKYETDIKITGYNHCGKLKAVKMAV